MNRKYRIDIPTGQQVNDAPESAATPSSATQPSALPANPPVSAEPRMAAAPAPASPKPRDNSPVSNSGQLKSGARFRIDAAESVQQLAETESSRPRTQGKPKQRYIDEPHSALPGPHFQVSTPKRTNLTSMTGQFLAYLGVLGLTVGTAMVIYGHFGGYAEYTPTGWLVTTVAQMMLFLGVINLVSGGIEQNNEEVSRRINSLGEQLVRIEQVTEQALRGPKLPARMYADPEGFAAESSRESAHAE